MDNTVLWQRKKRSVGGSLFFFQGGLGSGSVGWDLTPIGIMVRDFELPLPYREGHGRGFYLVRWRRHCIVKILVGEILGSAPLGAAGVGL